MQSQSQSMKEQQLFVTGGTGLLGSYLLRYLVQAGYQRIRALRRANSRMDLVANIVDKIEWIEGDILDVLFLDKAMEDVQRVYHCAAIVSFDPRDVDKMMQVNQEGTANLVNICLHHQVEKLIHVSSIAAIGRRPKTRIINEALKWERSHYNSNYAISKYLAEQEVWRGIAEGLTAAIVNPSVIMGSGFWDEGPTRFFKQVWEGLKFYPTGATGFVDVRDVAQFMIQLMESNIAKERYILNGENLQFQKVFNSIAKELHTKAPFIKVNPLLKSIAWRAEWLRTLFTRKKPMVTRDTANAAMRTFEYQNDKSLQVFDFKYTPIARTIAETSSQFLQALKEDFRPMGLPIDLGNK